MSGQPDWFDGVLGRATHGPDRYTHLPTTDWEGVVWGWRKGEELLAAAERERDALREALRTIVRPDRYPIYATTESLRAIARAALSTVDPEGTQE